MTPLVGVLPMATNSISETFVDLLDVLAIIQFFFLIENRSYAFNL